MLVVGEKEGENQGLRLKVCVYVLFMFCFSCKHSGILRGPQMKEYISEKRSNILGLALIKIVTVLG